MANETENNQLTILYRKRGQLKRKLTDIEFFIPTFENQFSSSLAQSDVIDLETALRLLENFPLADPGFYKPDKVDLLIHIQLFWALLANGQIKLNNGFPILQNIQLGWILSGPIDPTYNYPNQLLRCCLVSGTDLHSQLQLLWGLEEGPSKRSRFLQETACEQNSISTTYKDETGSFIVSTTWKREELNLGDSKTVALNRFHFLARRFQAHPQLQPTYTQFMTEYISLSHVTRVDSLDDLMPHYYMPRHGVINNARKTTKLCVVFDGLPKSVKATLGVNLDRSYAWTDSTITLAWVRTLPNCLKVFVSDRVAEIQENCKDVIWWQVPTADNPADVLSRGISPLKLIQPNIWFRGPSFLLQDETC
ncbi:hypothetical protein ILUMI_07455 [Ignelater luminosus]|uniref:Uncharacterized protein n=1 Tax=Ignelater luminosus TaxID=2038154 RepID=A0A8K0D7F8_IGNLU|nr:hypothetical protein ILUMI_07455 [Ignelater luminosus]